MVTYRPDARPILTPEQVGELLITPLVADSVAASVSTVVHTAAPAYRVPKVVADPTVEWVR